MVVRIRFGKAHKVGRVGRKNQRMALAVSSLLTPGACFAFVLAAWRVAADMNFTSSFAITSGMFSHWQVWVVTAAALQFGASRLNRYGKGDTAAS